MADSPTIDNGDLTDFKVATDDDGTAQHQYVKLEYGADGSITPVDANYPLPTTVITGPAAARTVDSISAALALDRLMNGLTAISPNFTAIDVASSGDNTLIAAQGSGNIIVVHSYSFVCAAAVTVRFESGAGGTALTGQMQFPANGGISVPFSPIGHFKTAADTLLNMELSGNISVDGHLTYTVIS